MDFPLWVFFLSSILICHLHLTTAQPDFFGRRTCGGGNYTENSDYQKNLDDVLYSLRTGTDNGFGFYNYTYGQAKAVALCQGDLEPESCRRCVEDATQGLRQLCTNKMEAAGWYDTCFLRYSNQSMGYTSSVEILDWNTINVSDSSYDQWKRTVANLLGGLRQEAAAGGQFRKYASGNKTGQGWSTIFGVMQCTPDLSSLQCVDCLTRATSLIRPYDRSSGVRVYLTSCVIRYEGFSFFNSTWYPAPPPSTPPPSAPPTTENTKSTNIGVIVGPILAAAAVIAIVIFFYILRRRQKQKRKDGFSDGSPKGSKQEMENDDEGEMNSFKLSTIHVATNHFSAENKLGEGGFGPVYKGILQDGKKIAVKRLSRNSGQGLVEFKTEVKLIIKLQHKNLVRLLGYCVKGTERILVYEFMANNSLDTFLFDPNKCEELDWAKRANIVSGIAKGLQYLHEDSRLKIVHRDMKASNILLDDEMNSKISDFGTARIFGGKQMEANTSRIVGTLGYMAPEYAMEGSFSTKSDVYSFGVLLLEIISGQQNNKICYQDEPQNLLSTAWHLWKENKGEQLIDHCLIQNVPIDEALRWINIALLCVQGNPQDRPTMSNVVVMLEGLSLLEKLATPTESPFTNGF